MPADQQRISPPVRKARNRFALGLSLLTSLAIHLALLSVGQKSSPLPKPVISLAIRYVQADALTSPAQAATGSTEAAPPAPSTTAHAPAIVPETPVAPRFIPAEELSKHPSALAELDTEQFEGLPRETLGSARLSLWIDAGGQVVGVTHEDGNLPEEVAALLARSFSQLPFSPGEIDGRAVASQMTVEVRLAPAAGAISQP